MSSSMSSWLGRASNYGSARLGERIDYSGFCKSFPASCHQIVRAMGYEEAQQGSESRTAFRLAEKKYKRYKEAGTSGRRRKGNRHGSQGSAPTTDLNDVLDFRKVATLIGDTEAVVQGVSRLQNDYGFPVFVHAERPGFYFLPNVLTPKQQRDLIQESLTTYLTPPNQTNHTATLGHIHGLWEAAQANLGPSDMKKGHAHTQSGQGNKFQTRQECPELSDVCAEDRQAIAENEPQLSTSIMTHSEEAVQSEFQRVGMSQRSEDTVPSYRDDDHEKNEEIPSLDAGSLPCEVPPWKLLRKLRWATLGLQFDWMKKAYNLQLPYNPFPQNLAELATKLAKPAVGTGEQFNAQAAIVNFYGPDAMLGGHVDDLERNWSKPIVSFSLGCEAIFLLGGSSRKESPLAMYLRSGDVILMAGPARQCFHAVPRILTAEDGVPLPTHLQEETASMSFKPFAEYIRDSRININVREVD